MASLAPEASCASTIEHQEPKAKTFRELLGIKALAPDTPVTASWVLAESVDLQPVPTSTGEGFTYGELCRQAAYLATAETTAIVPVPTPRANTLAPVAA